MKKKTHTPLKGTTLLKEAATSHDPRKGVARMKDAWYQFVDSFDALRTEIADNGVLHFRCPACGGECEEREYAGGYEGVTWRCACCHGYGTVGLWKKLLSFHDWWLFSVLTMFGRRK